MLATIMWNKLPAAIQEISPSEGFEALAEFLHYYDKTETSFQDLAAAPEHAKPSLKFREKLALVAVKYAHFPEDAQRSVAWDFTLEQLTVSEQRMAKLIGIKGSPTQEQLVRLDEVLQPVGASKNASNKTEQKKKPETASKDTSKKTKSSSNNKGNNKPNKSQQGGQRKEGQKPRWDNRKNSGNNNNNTGESSGQPANFQSSGWKKGNNIRADDAMVKDPPVQQTNPKPNWTAENKKPPWAGNNQGGKAPQPAVKQQQAVVQEVAQVNALPTAIGDPGN